MQLTKEEWERYKRSNSQKRRKSARLKEIHAFVTNVRNQRNQRKGGDSLLAANARTKLRDLRRERERQSKLDDMNKERIARADQVRNLPTYELWSKDRQKAALALAEWRPLDENTALHGAMLNLLNRQAKKEGWAIRKSKGPDGILGSIYVTPTGLGEVRISTHALPMTHTRQIAYENGVRGKWVGELLVADVLNLSLDEIMSEIKELANEELDDEYIATISF